jgi:segregation and condensation protein B
VDRTLALLFVSTSPVTSLEISRALQLTEGQVEQAIELLESHLAASGPLQLLRLAGGYQLSTKAEYVADVAAFLQPQRSKLSRSLMEVLAIVAYRQPITTAEIEEIRGASCDYGIRALAERRLIEEKGRRPTPGRPMLYGTTDEFLHQFKMDSLADLPAVAPALFALPNGTINGSHSDSH